MKKLKSQVITFFLIFLVIIGIAVEGSIQNQIYIPTISINEKQGADDFYFIHITDTHVVNKFLDKHEIRKHWLISLLENVTSFDKQPAFVVITGDLVEWGGGFLGALNYYSLIATRLWAERSETDKSDNLLRFIQIISLPEEGQAPVFFLLITSSEVLKLPIPIAG